MKQKIILTITAAMIAGTAIAVLYQEKRNAQAPDEQLEEELYYDFENEFRNDSIAITELIKYGKEGNLKALASLFSYPIDRKYPIPPIKDSADFVRRASVIWDDSLKQVLQDTKFEEWRRYGWRGCSFRDGYYLWVDGGKVFAINYFSAEEQKLWKELVRNEIASLHPSLQKGIETPCFSFRTTKGEWHGRVDLMKDEKYRLALYKGTGAPGEKPYFAARDSSFEIEGSMGNQVFAFPGDSVKVGLFVSRYITSSIEITTDGIKKDYEIEFVR